MACPGHIQQLLAKGGLGLRKWGAAEAEQAMIVPGDELMPESADVTTLAVSIDAPREAVWPWLIQIGQDRGGM